MLGLPSFLRSRLAIPAAALFAFVVASSAVSAQRYAGSGNSQQGQGRGSNQTVKTAAPQPPQTTAKPADPNRQQQPPSAEGFLGWDWWKDDAVKKELKLTDGQVLRISRYFDDRVREVTPFWNDFLKQRGELEKMTEEGAVDIATYRFQVNKVEALRSKLNETRTVMLYAISKQLDKTQLQKLKEIRDRRRRGGGPPTPRTW